MKPRRMEFLAIATLLVAGLIGCATAPKSEEGKSKIESDAEAVVARAKTNDSSLGAVLDKSAGYAVFPVVAKAAVAVGGAYGRGVLYVNGAPVGYCDLSQASVGLALGGQGYSEIIAFETPDDVKKFKEGHFALDAQATAVALRSGAGANAKYKNGVAVFTMGEAGLMYEASIGGQKFNYQPKT
jgi:lipid-binding SYLF domain-containing protein